MLPTASRQVRFQLPASSFQLPASSKKESATLGPRFRFELAGSWTLAADRSGLRDVAGWLAFRRRRDDRARRVDADTAGRAGGLRVLVRCRPVAGARGDRWSNHARRHVELQVGERGGVVRAVGEEGDRKST